MPRFAVHTRINRGAGGRVPIGQIVEMGLKEADPYLRAKALTLIPEKPPVSEEVADALREKLLGIGNDDAEILSPDSKIEFIDHEGAGSEEPTADPEPGGLDELIEKAIRAFGPEDFTKACEPRMSALGDAVQPLAHPNGEESGVVIEAEDRDRVFKLMVEAGFVTPEPVNTGENA